MLTLLFDIDGTLISTGGAGTVSLEAAMRDEFGIAEPREVPVSGRTDRGIARQLFALHAIEDNEENWRRFRDAYLGHLQRWLPRREGRVLPGVEGLLARAASRTQTLTGLLTGNVRDGARLKLEHYRLDRYFAFGGFGDRHPHRDDVAREALDASRRHAESAGGAPSNVWVIGDTPLDVACARTIGARALAVATGIFSAGELAAAQPDVLCDDLSDVGAVCQQLGVA